jgi:hypothetical protein
MSSDEGLREEHQTDERLREEHQTSEATPWGTGLTVAAFVAAITAVAIVVLSLGVSRVHPLLAVGLNVIAVGGLAPTLWGWRGIPVLRWFVLGGAVGIAGGWLALLAIALQRA